VIGRRLGLGLLAAGVYVASAVGFAGDGPVLPLYEGVPLDMPYRWVNPPPEFAAGNVPPVPTKQEVAMTETGTVSASVLTDDGQAALVLREGAFAPRLGEIVVIVEIVPLDPATVDDPPEAVRHDGNAYRMTATYPKENAPASLAVPATVVLRSPLGGTRLLRHDGTSWAEISAQPVAASLQVFGETSTLGIFVAGQTIHGKPFPWLPVSLGASGVTVLAALYAARRSRSAKRAATQPRRVRRAAERTSKPTPDPGRPRPSPKRKKKRR
jgi:hypothetical protein